MLPRKSLVASFESLKRRPSSVVEDRRGDEEGGGIEESAEAMTKPGTPKSEQRRSSTLPVYAEKEKILDLGTLQQPPRKRTRKRRAFTKPR